MNMPQKTTAGTRTTSYRPRNRRGTGGPIIDPQQDLRGVVDPLSLPLTLREGFAAHALAPAPTRPRTLSKNEIESLDVRARGRYDEERQEWHAQIHVETAQFVTVKHDVARFLKANRPQPNQVMPSVALDGDATLGKTTLLQGIAMNFYREQVEREGPVRPDGSEFVPVVWLELGARTSPKQLNAALCRFFSPSGETFQPYPARLDAPALAQRARFEMDRCGTRMIVVDDIHRASPKNRDGRILSNHLKSLATTLGLRTWLFAGLGLARTGILDAGPGAKDENQSGRRWKTIEVYPHARPATTSGTEWQDLIYSLEQRLVLAKHRPGSLAHQASEYLWDRTQGYIGALTALVREAAVEAMMTGEEAIDRNVLSRIQTDYISEQAYKRRAA